MSANTQQPLSLNDAQSSTLSPAPYDAAGSAVALPAGSTCTYAGSDAGAVLSITPNADGVSAVLKGVAAGTSNVTATLTVPGASAPFTAVMPVTVVSSAIAGFTIAFTPPA